MRVPTIRFAHVRRGKDEDPPGLVGMARVDVKTKVLVRRLEPGDIAIIDPPALDRVSADELIAARVAAVVNAAKSVTGRYPNLGPRLLLDAGIPLVDDAGQEVLSKIADGAVVRLDKDVLYNDSDQVVAKGVLLTEDSLAAVMAEANAGVPAQIDAFAANTLEFLRRERDLLTNGVSLPRLATSMKDRHVLVVVRGYREDLRTLRPYIREYRPVLLAVDGGADALLEAGYQPQLIIGDMDSVSDEALQVGAELVVHAYPDGRAPGMQRIKNLGLDAEKLPAPGTS